MIRSDVFDGLYSPDVCRQHPNRVFVFGDNAIRKGMAGQAIIRHEVNAFGVATKRYPSVSEGAYFDDSSIDDRQLLLSDLRQLYRLGLLNPGLVITFPKAGLGTGLAMMEKRAPKLFNEMNQIICEHFGVSF